MIQAMSLTSSSSVGLSRSAIGGPRLGGAEVRGRVPRAEEPAGVIPRVPTLHRVRAVGEPGPPPERPAQRRFPGPDDDRHVAGARVVRDADPEPDEAIIELGLVDGHGLSSRGHYGP